MLPKRPDGNGVEMVLKRLAQGAKTTGESAPVDGHDESHRRAHGGAGLIVGAGDVILDRVIEGTLVGRHLQEAIVNPAVGDRCGQHPCLEISPQQCARVP